MKQWVRLLNAFLKEAHWLNCGALPSSEKYLNNGIVSTGVHVVLLHAFFLLDHSIDKDIVTTLDNFPQIIHSVAKILRLSDDLEGTKVKLKQVLFYYSILYIIHTCHVLINDVCNIRVKIKMDLMGHTLIAT